MPDVAWITEPEGGRVKRFDCSEKTKMGPSKVGEPALSSPPADD